LIQQNSAATSQHGQLPEGAVGSRMRDLSGGKGAQARYWRRPGFATSSCLRALGWPTGNLADARWHRRPTVRCLYGG